MSSKFSCFFMWLFACRTPNTAWVGLWNKAVLGEVSVCFVTRCDVPGWAVLPWPCFWHDMVGSFKYRLASCQKRNQFDVEWGWVKRPLRLSLKWTLEASKKQKTVKVWDVAAPSLKSDRNFWFVARSVVWYTVAHRNLKGPSLDHQHPRQNFSTYWLRQNHDRIIAKMADAKYGERASWKNNERSDLKLRLD